MIEVGSNRLRRLISVVGLILLLVTACGSAPSRTPPSTADRPAPQATAQPATKAAPAIPKVAAKPIFVEFYTTWCAPCKQMDPIISRLEDEYGTRVDFKILDAAGAAPEKQKYHYVSQPQVVIVNTKGEIVNTLYGFQGYDALKKQLDAVLGASSS